MSILTINAGSSSIKFALYPIHAKQIESALISGMVEGLQTGGEVFLSWRKKDETARFALNVPKEASTPIRFQTALHALQSLFEEKTQGTKILGIAHRVVHGGSFFREAIIVDETRLEQLRSLCPLAPLHQPHNLAGIEMFAQTFPDVPQVACFDTAFHADVPEEEYLFAIPKSLSQEGVRRYGFHGLSYHYVMEALQRHSQRANGRTVMAHLGNGASLCAALAGKSHATSMGFSALDGLMMGTRSGSIDPGVILHLLAQGWTQQDVQRLLYSQSGLLGVSNVSADMRSLRQSDAPDAALAIRLFTYRVVREIGAMIATIGGIDVLAFTGGIGEHDSQLREDVCKRLHYLGVQIDEEKNRSENGSKIAALHHSSSAIEIYLVPTDEGRVAAGAAAKLLV